MSETVRKHMIRYPAARTSTIQYLARREETTEQLRREILAAENKASKHTREFQPWWRRILVLLRGEANV
jgi:hypothetical protein